MGAPPVGVGRSLAPPPTDRGARKALIGGVVSVFFCGILVGPASIIEGVRARKRIRESQGALGGDGMAVAGIALGSFTTCVNVIAIVVVALASMNAPKQQVSLVPALSSLPPIASVTSTTPPTPPSTVFVRQTNFAITLPAEPAPEVELTDPPAGLRLFTRVESSSDGEKVGVLSATIDHDNAPATDQLLIAAVAAVTDRRGTSKERYGTFRTFRSFSETGDFADPAGAMLATAFATTEHIYVLYVVGPTPDRAALKRLEDSFSL